MLLPFGSWKSCVCAWNIWDIRPQDSHKTVVILHLGLRSHVASLERPSSAISAGPHLVTTSDRSNRAYLICEDQRSSLSCLKLYARLLRRGLGIQLVLTRRL